MRILLVLPMPTITLRAASCRPLANLTSQWFTAGCSLPGTLLLLVMLLLLVVVVMLLLSAKTGVRLVTCTTMEQQIDT
jgi:hypothetical protein